MMQNFVCLSFCFPPSVRPAQFVLQCLIFLSLALLFTGCATREPEVLALPDTVEAPVHQIPGDLEKLLERQAGLSNATCNLKSTKEFEQEALRLVNEVRKRGRFCGETYFYPAAPLKWRHQLLVAANYHSIQMAQANLISHNGVDLSELRDRVKATGYHYVQVNENIAAGISSVEAAIRAWEKSPSHCVNLMDPELQEIGVACIHKPSSFYHYYWTMDLGRPMPEIKLPKPEKKRKEGVDFWVEMEKKKP